MAGNRNGVSRIVPSTINSGINFNAQTWQPNFSGAEWTLELLLRGTGTITLTGERESARHVFSANAAETATWATGEYTYFLRAVSGSDAHLIEQGGVRVLPDVSKIADGTDIRSRARKALDAIDAVLDKRATIDQKSYRINNRELERTDIKDLIALRAHYFDLVQREEAKARGKSLFGRQVKFHMGPR